MCPLLYSMSRDAEPTSNSFMFPAAMEANSHQDMDFNVMMVNFLNTTLIYIMWFMTSPVFMSGLRAGVLVEAFVRSMYKLVQHCEFGYSKDEQIRDLVVIGIPDKKLSKCGPRKRVLTPAMICSAVTRLYCDSHRTQVGCPKPASWGSPGINQVLRPTVWWPGIRAQIIKKMKSGHFCAEHKLTQRHEQSRNESLTQQLQVRNSSRFLHTGG